MHTKRSRRRRLTSVLAITAATALVAAACGDDDDDADSGPSDSAAPADTGATGDTGAPDDSGGSDGEGGEIRIAWIPWEDAIAVTNLWAEILEGEGYSVELQQLDVAPTFKSVADGDNDLYLDAWLPATHEAYWNRFQSDLEDLGTWYEEATLELTVPSYVEEVNSLEDLAENADLFDKTITGIEAGAGEMKVLAEKVVPAYGLEDWTIKPSSTPAMRAELKKAYDNEEPIVVTLWSPHPEYAQKDLKKLEDPKGAWGEPDSLHAIGTSGFSSEFPEVAEWLGNFTMTPDQMADLEAQIAEAGEGNEREAAAGWIEENQDVVDGWLSGEGGAEAPTDSGAPSATTGG